MSIVVFTLAVGIGATALADLWGYARKPLLGVAPPDYGLVGRWIGHMRSGRFQHAAIAKAAAIRGERLLGWSAHYAIGVLFAALLMLLGGEAWMRQPSPGLALAVGIGTVAAPFLLLQPGMGAGIAASRLPKPRMARVQSLLLHTVFGLGLYLSAALLNPFNS